MAKQWSGRQDKKQAEFLVEKRFPWELVEDIGVCSLEWAKKVNEMLISADIGHKPPVGSKPDWYY
jgi:hypothetical protein